MFFIPSVLDALSRSATIYSLGDTVWISLENSRDRATVGNSFFKEVRCELTVWYMVAPYFESVELVASSTMPYASLSIGIHSLRQAGLKKMEACPSILKTLINFGSHSSFDHIPAVLVGSATWPMRQITAGISASFAAVSSKHADTNFDRPYPVVTGILQFS